MNSEIIKLGIVGVDSGQLIICDPTYLEDEFKTGSIPHNSHIIYRHRDDGKLWQFCYFGRMPPSEGINMFPGGYPEIIPEYNLSPAELIEKGIFIETDLTEKQIPENEFSYNSICKITSSENRGGQLNYKLGHAGVAVAFSAGFGDGEYEVFAEIIQTKTRGKRVKKVWIELIPENEIDF